MKKVRITLKPFEVLLEDNEEIISREPQKKCDVMLQLKNKRAAYYNEIASLRISVGMETEVVEENFQEEIESLLFQEV